MIERTLTFPRADWSLYRKGVLYERWRRKHRQTQIFVENEGWVRKSNQIPTTCPHKIKRIYGFGELFAAVYYLNLGYEVTWEYWGRNWDAPSYRKAVKTLGEEAADFICKSQPQPPDLFVVDRKNRFFFVEVKLPTDRLNKKQIAFNRKIERYLNKNMPRSRRAPHMAKGSWIELLKLSCEGLS